MKLKTLKDSKCKYCGGEGCQYCDASKLVRLNITKEDLTELKGGIENDRNKTCK